MATQRVVQKGIKDTTGTNLVTVYETMPGMSAIVDLILLTATIETLGSGGLERNVILSMNIGGVEIDRISIPLTLTNGKPRTDVVTQFFLPLDPLPVGQDTVLHARVDEALDVNSEVRFIAAGTEGADV